MVVTLADAHGRMLGLPEFGGDRLEDRKNAPAGRVSFGEDELLQALFRPADVGSPFGITAIPRSRHSLMMLCVH
jgi:hypothetical protein